MKYQNITINKIVHAAFYIRYSLINIYIDPFSNHGDVDYSSMRKADFIFITHEHWDHCEPSVIHTLSKKTTKVYGNHNVQDLLHDIDIEVIDDTTTVVNEVFQFTTVPAYNLNKFNSEGSLFHPLENGGVGYIFNFGGTSIYHAGDTDFTQDMKNLSGIDVFLVPISGTYVMTPEEAAEAVQFLSPNLAIPMHFGAIVGGVAELNRFEYILKDRVHNDRLIIKSHF